MNDLILNVRKINRFLPSDDDDGYDLVRDRPYSIDEISMILDTSDIRSKTIILLMGSIGMRLGALPGLKLGDLKKIEEFGLYLIWVYNNSKKDRSFCTPECALAIDEYLSYRKRFGEALSDKTPLIRNFMSVDNPFVIKSPRFLTNRAVSIVVEDLLTKSGVNPQNRLNKKKGSKTRSVMRTHGFRKHVITCMSKANMNYTVKELLSGHKLPNQDSSYVLFTKEEMLQEYVKAIPLLTIRSENRVRQQIQELQSNRLQSIEEIKHKVLTELKEKYRLISKTEWETMKVEMKAIKENILPQYFKSSVPQFISTQIIRIMMMMVLRRNASEETLPFYPSIYLS
jgi:integrase